MAQILSLNLGLPLGMAMLDITESSFSAARQTFEQAKIGFRRQQKLAYENGHTPTYLWKLRGWLRSDPALLALAGRLETKGHSIFRHEFIPPVWPYVEPGKQVKADQVRLSMHMISPRKLMDETGNDWQDVTSEIVEDRSLLVRKAMDEANRLGDVTWRELLAPLGVVEDDATEDDDGKRTEKKGAEDKQTN